MPIPIPKPITYVNKDYEAWIKKQNCIFCRLLYSIIKKADDAHHIRRLCWGAGIGKKPHSYVCLPVCREHHDPKYEHLIEVEQEIINHLMRYIDEQIGG